MDELVESFINKEQEKELYKGINNCPNKLLGIHTLSSGQIIVVYKVNAESVKIRDEDSKLVYTMKAYHDKGLFVLYGTNMSIKRYQIITRYQDQSTVITHDPYSFPLMLGEMDIYLFLQGKHYEIYRKLGAHIQTVEKVRGTIFRVWAPHARAVSVVGDFNCWDGTLHPMIMIGETGIYELFIPGVNEGDLYKFQIKTRMGTILYKADPFANQSELRPNTASIVTNINQFRWSDQKWEREKKKKNRLTLRDESLLIYEVHLGSWKRKENGSFYTYKEIAMELISYVKKMGYTHIELIGLAEHPYDGSWGYQVTGYYAPTSRYGTMHDFMYFINSFHRNGIGVILDWVPGHFPKDDCGLARFDGEALYEYKDKTKAEHKEWGTYRFDYTNKSVVNFLISNALYWINEFHIDGLRVDAVASMLYLDYGKKQGEWTPNENGGRENLEAADFLRNLNTVIEKIAPHVVMIAEDSSTWQGVTAPVSMGGLGFLYKWNLGWMNDFLQYMKLDPYFRQFNHRLLVQSFQYMYSENFILVLSHDEVVHLKGTLIDKMPGDVDSKFANLRLVYAFMLGHPGKKLLFMGQEFAQWQEWNEQKSLDWGLLQYENHKKMKSYVKDLNLLYKKYSSLHQYEYDHDSFNMIEGDNAQLSILAFCRSDPQKKEGILFVYNFTPVQRKNYKLSVFACKYFQLLLDSSDSRYSSNIRDSSSLSKKIQLEVENNQHFIKIDLKGLSCAIYRYVL